MNAGMADLGHHEYGRQFEVFSLTPGNQADATITLILWYKQTLGMDTLSRLTNRFVDPQALFVTKC